MRKADEERAKRLSEALRENLRRRKAQAREAEQSQTDTPGSEQRGEDASLDDESGPSSSGG